MVNKIVLDLHGSTSERDLHEYMHKRFGTPKYYEHNPDALWDAVYPWFDQPTVIEAKNLDKLPASMKTAGKRLRLVFQDLDREGPCVQVAFHP